LGQKYDNFVETQKISFADQISRKMRENVMVSRDGKRQPPVGLYHPKEKVVSKRPQTHEFSRIGKFSTAGMQKPFPEPTRVP